MLTAEKSMLTEKAQSERKWGWLPALRLILESKRVPERYFGASSVSDNMFDRLRRLLEIDILVQENRAQIIEKLSSESRDQIMEDLHRLREAFRYAKRELQAAEGRVEDIMNSGR
jgi:hypothetical protein